MSVVLFMAVIYIILAIPALGMVYFVNQPCKECA